MPKILLMSTGFPLSWPGWRLVMRSALVAGAALAAVAHAEKADRAQPLVFAADAARVDEASRVNILTGRVEITKGTMVVRADRVEVRQNPGGTQTAVASGGQEGRAYFRQKREGLNEFIEGEALRITYDGVQDLVVFSGRAVMRRLSGGQAADRVSGDTITYDNKTGVFQVAGAPAANSGASRGRVQGVITPRSDAPNAAGPAGR